MPTALRKAQRGEYMDIVAPITPAEICEHHQEAKEKLSRIIQREGDADGARLEPSYFHQILVETIRSHREAEKMRKGVMSCV